MVESRPLHCSVNVKNPLEGPRTDYPHGLPSMSAHSWWSAQNNRNRPIKVMAMNEDANQDSFGPYLANELFDLLLMTPERMFMARLGHQQKSVKVSEAVIAHTRYLAGVFDPLLMVWEHGLRHTSLVGGPIW